MKKTVTLLFLTLFAIGFSKNVCYSHNILPPALALSYTYTQPTCPGLNNGAINATVKGGSLPYSDFSLSNGTTILKSPTGTFTDLAPGTYTLSISDAFSTVSAPTNIIIIAPSDLSISLPKTICAGTPTTLSVSGSTTSYLWTANPVDASLTALNNTSASPTVSPLTTTTYTVTSTSNSPSSNMVTNGDFSLGNTGFTSDYQYIANAGVNGVQRAYGVVNKAINWFQFFPSCNIEHPGLTGNMMVIDGSTSNAGTDKVWGQTITVQPNQTYTFSYWVQTLAMPDPANIELKINGVVIGTNLAPSTQCSWSLRTYTWDSGSATSAQIALYDKVIISTGNDFSLDDISFTTNVVCNLSKTVLITAATGIIPTFTQVGAICSGASLTLPTTSNELITGAWSTPPIISPSTTFLFTPDAGQCANTTTMTVTVNAAQTTPTFTQVGAICTGASLTLPTTSNELITGAWSTPPIISPSTTFLFTPDAGQCANTTTMAVIVIPKTTPTFTQVAAVCSGATMTALPTSSTDATPITGNWSPAVNNTTTTLYTFTPTTGLCANTATMTITVTPKTTPTFTQVAAVCSGATMTALPTSSTDTTPITGNWSPALDNSATTLYTFTPTTGLCATTATMTITVTPFPQFSITQGCDGTDFVMSATGIGATNANYMWYDNLHQNIGTDSSIIITNQGNYSLELSNNGCSEEKPITVANIFCSIPKGISPNGDGDNDTFDLRNLNVKELQIFNRYGVEVYSKSNYSNEWIGKSNSGMELPDGTYYYIVHFSSGKAKTGWVYINK